TTPPGAGAGGSGGHAAKSVVGGVPLTTCTGGGPGTLIGPGASGAGVGCLSGNPGDPLGLTGGGDGSFKGAGGGGYFGGGTGASGPSPEGFSRGGGGPGLPDPATPAPRGPQ